MTIQGAMNELVNLLKADDIPIYYKGGIEKVIETIDDYIDGKDDYIKRKISNSSEKPNNCEDEPTWEQVKEYCNKRCLDIVDSAMRKQWYKDEPQTETSINSEKVQLMDEPQTDEHCETCRHKDECEGATYEYKNTEWWCLAYAPIDEPQTDCAWMKGE